MSSVQQETGRVKNEFRAINLPAADLGVTYCDQLVTTLRPEIC